MTLKKWIDDGVLGKVCLVTLDILRRRGIPTWGQFHIKEKTAAILEAVCRSAELDREVTAAEIYA